MAEAIKKLFLALIVAALISCSSSTGKMFHQQVWL